jgi:hypothetical protein
MINTPHLSTAQSLCPSTSTHHPPSIINAIPSCGRHMCHVTTSRVHLHVQHSHTPSRSSPAILSPLMLEPPPLLSSTRHPLLHITWWMLVPHHCHLCRLSHLQHSTNRGHAHAHPAFTYLSRISFSYIHSDIHVLVRARWAHVQPDTPHSRSFKTCLATFRILILNMADVSAHIRLNVKPHCSFSLCLLGSCHNADVITMT